MALFCSWSFKANSSLSKSLNCLFFKSFFVLHFAVLVRVKQVVVKVNLKNTTGH